ncbi:TonB-dependent Receptor Plug Domain [Dyadobacter sp. SG02]|nr:TonB-dependent Receptor Plug Domain [Dyadobacter sp. SG02]
MLLSGTQSGDDGSFGLAGIVKGRYMLRFTSLSYTGKAVEIELANQQALDLDTIQLLDSQLSLKQVTVRGEREKAKSDVSKTTFQIGARMQQLAASGVDLLKQLPGISIDLAQNISLEGSTKVIILVNGMERDGKYLNQLPASDIDKIEIMANPPARYDAGASRVINVVLKSDRRAGLSGNINMETPTIKKQIYTFPSARLSYGRGKVDAFASYSGSLGYFDIVEQSRREGSISDQKTSISSSRNERQKNWSHRFSYGLDYTFNEQNSITLYGNFNPYSQELDGNIRALYQGRSTTKWDYLKEDTDRNLGSFYSLFYKSALGKRKRGELTVDGSYYHLRAKNQSVFTDLVTGSIQANLVRPVQNTFNLRTDYALPISKSLRLATGFQLKSNRFADQNQSNFRYGGTNQALHGSVRFSKQKVVSEVSLRLEQAVFGIIGSKALRFVAFLPNVAFQYQLREGVSLKANYQKVLEYPGLYQLNPFQMLEDPNTYRSGNPGLRPAKVTNLGIEYSRSYGKNFISLRAFYNNREGAINDLTRLTESGEFITQLFNLGTIQQIGSQFTGTFSVGKAIQLQSYMKLFRAFTQVNNFAISQGLGDRQKMAYELAMSASASLPYGLAVAAQFTYNSPTTEMQKMAFANALYFISLQKTFSSAVRTGITFALPFGKIFTYQGEKIRSETLTSDIKKTINLTMLPVFLKVSYTFSKGGKRKQVNGSNEETGIRQRKGF